MDALSDDRRGTHPEADGRGEVARSPAAFGLREHHPPRPRAGEIERIRLLHPPFAGQTDGVVLIAAPAGYGKSILAAQVCAQDPWPVAWCELHQSDNDPLVLIAHLVEGLARIGPVEDWYLASCRRPSARGEAPLLAGLAGCMASCSPFVLVFDDAHVVSSERSTAVLQRVVHELPAGCQMLAVARSEPDLGVARLRVSGDVVEIRSDELAFDREECERFLSTAGIEFDEEAVVELESRTEGWPAGAALATLSLRAPSLSGSAVRAFSGDVREVADYLFDEVLARQSKAMRSFLVETSVVRRLSAPLCDFMLERHVSGEILRQLERTNLFIIRLDDHREWYRYHHLFQDMLRAELDRTAPERSNVLLRRAAAWHEEHGAPEEAFEYARMSGDHTRAGRVLLCTWEQYANHGRLETLRLWLRACRDDQIESDTALCIAAGWVFVQLGDAERAERYVAVAERRPDLDQPSPDGHTSLRSAMVNLRSAMGSRGVRQMLEDARFVYAAELPRRTRWLLGGCRSIGISCLLLGRHVEAVAALEEARMLSQEREAVGFARVLCLGYLALAYVDGGEWAKANELIAETTALVERLGMQETPLALPELLRGQRQRLHAGRPEAALQSLHRVSRSLQMAAAGPWLLADIASRCAAVSVELGDVAGARAFTDRAIEGLRRLPDAGVMTQRVQVLATEVAGDSHLSMLTATEVAVLRQLATYRTLAEIGDELSVSRSTVKHHVASIYRKLDVGSRAEAVDRLGRAD